MKKIKLFFLDILENVMNFLLGVSFRTWKRAMNIALILWVLLFGGVEILNSINPELGDGPQFWIYTIPFLGVAGFAGIMFLVTRPSTD